VLSDSGELNRSALAKIVFESPEKRLHLNSILHPLIKERTKQLLSEFASDAIVVYNVPLLVEAAVDHDFDLVVTVEAPEDAQIKRLTEIRGLSLSEAQGRIASQAKPVERAARADRILNSNQDVAFLLRDADKLWREIEVLASANRGQ
jgi:dephospho-CoA kinase